MLALPTEKTKKNTDFLTMRTAIVSRPKLGKSTFASQLGESVFCLDTESGYTQLEVFSRPVKEWSDFEGYVKLLTTTKHGFTTVVLDIVDKIIEMAETEICKRNKVTFLKDMAFGSGYIASKKLFFGEIEKLHSHGLGITFVTHEKLKEIKLESMAWTAVGTSMSQSYEEPVLGCCDIVLYVFKAANGQHTLRSKPTKYITCAGDRTGLLPELMPLDAKLVLEALKGKPITQTPVVTKIESKTTTQKQLQ